MAIAGASILLLLGLIVTGAIVVKRRRPIVLDDGTLDRRTTIIVLAALVGLTTLSNLNSLPSQLFRYDTAEPWGSFIGTTALGLVVVIPLMLIVLAIWLALGAMRRRVGIPMLGGEPSPSASRDMLIAGLGLAGFAFTMSQIGALVPQAGMPRTPGTALNDVFPALSGIVDIPSTALMTVAVLGIPLLVVAGLSQRWSLRALMAASIVVLLGAILWSFGPATDVDPFRATLVIALLAMVSIAFVVWGSVAAWSWIVAALAYQGLGGLRNAVYGYVWQERVAGVLTLLIASGLVAHIARRATRAPQGSLTSI